VPASEEGRSYAKKSLEAATAASYGSRSPSASATGFMRPTCVCSCIATMGSGSQPTPLSTCGEPLPACVTYIVELRFRRDAGAETVQAGEAARWTTSLGPSGALPRAKCGEKKSLQRRALGRNGAAPPSFRKKAYERHRRVRTTERSHRGYRLAFPSCSVYFALPSPRDAVIRTGLISTVYSPSAGSRSGIVVRLSTSTSRTTISSVWRWKTLT
jgi:hypothetical protein